MSLTVTVVDEQTGESQTGRVEDGDYMLLVVAPCYLGSVQAYPTKGTHVITVKGRKNGLAPKSSSPDEKSAGSHARVRTPTGSRAAQARRGQNP